MSADLLAAFGADNEEQSVNSNSKHQQSDGLSSHNVIEESTWQPWPSPAAHNPQTQGISDSRDDGLWTSDDKGNDVLFDANDLDQLHVDQNTEDDFGDFEDVESAAQPMSQLPQRSAAKVSTNLLDIDDNATSTPSSVTLNPSSAVPAPQMPSRLASHVGPEKASIGADDDWGNFEDAKQIYPADAGGPEHNTAIDFPVSRSGVWVPQISPKTDHPGRDARIAVPSKIAETPSVDGFDAWDEFEDGPPQAATQEILQSPRSVPAANLTNTKSMRLERPTNIPPPAVLLSLLAKVWSMLAAETRHSNAEGTVGKLAVQLYRVSARTISGRSLRWKRDTILAQSMRIGAAGRSGGMKLTSLDKGENRKEEQEAEEVIASWTRNSHVLGGAMTRAKVQKLPISLSMKLLIRTATGSDVLSANHICPICGLKRNERINGIDVNVSDTFNEFWIELWGHTDCHDFWYRYNELLDHR